LEIPGIVLAHGETKRERAVEDQGGILADIVSAVGVAALDRAIRDRIENLQAGPYFARRECVDLEFSVAHLADELRHRGRGTPQTLDAFREARSQAPLDGRLLRDRRRGNPSRTRGGRETREIPA